MKIKEIRIRNFRNLSEVILEPHSRLNFFVGKNAQGKTSLLEAAYFLSNLQSFRGGKPENLIQFEKEISTLEATVVDKSENGDLWESEFKVVFKRDLEKKKVQKQTWINGTQIPTSTKYLSFRFGLNGYSFHSISFNPSDHQLISGDPSVRRSYLNAAISSESPEYLLLLKRVAKVLSQRNGLLKSKYGMDESMLATYTDQLVQIGSEIVLERLKWINRVQINLSKHIKRIAPEQGPITHFYASNYLPETLENIQEMNKKEGLYFSGQQSLPSLELINQSFRKKLEQKKHEERILGLTLVGPHRDDWNLIMNEEPLKKHGSQGEIRSALLALKLSEVELFQESTGIQPLFMLDDFSSELDQNRRMHLMNFLNETNLQVWITSTEELSGFHPVYEVESGKIQSFPQTKALDLG